MIGIGQEGKLSEKFTWHFSIRVLKYSLLQA